jgi:hypothetical protein
VLLPTSVLKELFVQSGRDKSPIPIQVTLHGKKFIQTLVKYAGKWRLYLNTPMRDALRKDVGEMIDVEIEFDPKPRTTEMNAKLKMALDKNKKALAIFNNLTPSYQKEIVRYINQLKTEESVDRNVEKATQHLLGKARFIGRDGIR